MSLDTVLDLLRCPVCEGVLALDAGSVGCAQGHRYDLARQGYLNLLGRPAPANADTQDMVAARSRFLGAGHYAPVSDAVRDGVSEVLPVAGAPRVLEVGAGTGHYAARLLDDLDGRGVALDVSVAAARRAARAHPRLGAVVADVWTTLPLPDRSVDVVLAVFAPRHPSEFARVLPPGGVAVVVTPDPEHLAGLREELGLLDIEPAKQERLAASMPAELVPRTRRRVRFAVELDETAVGDLVAMGPNAFHTDPTGLRDRVRHLALPLEVEVAVSVGAWSRR